MVLLKLLNLGHVLRLLKDWKVLQTLRQDAYDVCLGLVGRLELLDRVYFAYHIDGLYSLYLLANLVYIVNILTRFIFIMTWFSPSALMSTMGGTFAADDIDGVIRVYDIARLNYLG